MSAAHKARFVSSTINAHSASGDDGKPSVHGSFCNPMSQFKAVRISIPSTDDRDSTLG